MLCRILLTAAAILCTFSRVLIVHANNKTSQQLEQIKDIVCVLLLSGLTREDLNEDTVQKLKQHNVDFDTINTKEMRDSCLGVNFTNDSSQYINENIVRKPIYDYNGSTNCVSGQNDCDNKTNSELIMDKTEPDFTAYLWNVTKYALTLLHDKISLESKEGVENYKVTKDKTENENLELDNSVTNKEILESREGIENVTKLNKTHLSQNSLWNVSREALSLSNNSNNNVNSFSSYETTATPSNYDTTEYINNLHSEYEISNKKKQLKSNDYSSGNYNGNFKMHTLRNLINLKQINNNLNVYPNIKPTSVKYKDNNVEQVTTSQENGKLSEIIELLSNIHSSLKNVKQSYTPKTSLQDNYKSDIAPKNKYVTSSTKKKEDIQIVTSPTKLKLTRSQDNILSNYTQLLKVPNLVTISKLLQQIFIIPPEANLNLSHGNVPNLLREIKKGIGNVSTNVNNNSDEKSNDNLIQKDFQQKDLIQLLSDSLWEKLRTKLPMTTTPSTTKYAISTVGIGKKFDEEMETLNISLSDTITPNLIQDIVNKVKNKILKEFKNESIGRNTEKPTNREDKSEDIKLMRDFLNVFKQLKNEILPTTKKISTKNSDFQINSEESGRQAMKSITETQHSLQRNIVQQYMIPSIQYSMPRKSPVMIQTNLFEIPPLYQPETMLGVTNLLLKPKETYGFNRNDRRQKVPKNLINNKFKDEKAERLKTIKNRINNNLPKINTPLSTFDLTLYKNKPNLNNMLLTQISDMYLKDPYNKDTMNVKKYIPTDNNKIYDDSIQSSLNTQSNYIADATKINAQWNSDFNAAVWNKLTQKNMQYKQNYDSRLRSALYKSTSNTLPIEQNGVKKTEDDYDVYTLKNNNGNIDYTEFFKNIKDIISKGSPFQAQVNSKIKSRNKDVYIDSVINRDSTSNMSFKERNIYSKGRKYIEKRVKYLTSNKNTDDVFNTITHFKDKTKIKINSQELIQSAKQISIKKINVPDLLKKLKNEKFHMDSSDTPTIDNNSDSDKEMPKINSDYISKEQATRNTLNNPNLYQELLTNIQKDVLQFVQNRNSKLNDIQDNFKINVNDNSINVNLNDSQPFAQKKDKDKMLMNNDIIEQLNNLVSKLKVAQYMPNVIDNKNKQTSLSSLDKTTEAVNEHSTTKLCYDNNTYAHKLENDTLHDIVNTKLDLTENLNLNNINVYHDLVEKIKDGTINSNNVQDIINEIIKNILDSKSKSNEDTTKRNDVSNDLIITRIKDEVMKSDNFTDIFRGIIKELLHSVLNEESVTAIEKPSKEVNISSSKNYIQKDYNDNTHDDTAKENIDSLTKSDLIKADPSIYDELINQNFDLGMQQKNNPNENNVNMDIFNDLISLNKVTTSASTTITYKEIISNFRESFQGEDLKNMNTDYKPTKELKQDISNKNVYFSQYGKQNPNYNNMIKAYIKDKSNTNSNIYKDFIKHSSVFGLKSNYELQTTSNPNSEILINPKSIKTADPYILQHFLNKMESPIKTSYEPKTEEKYKGLKNDVINSFKPLSQYKKKENQRVNRKQPSMMNSDYDEIKIRNTYKYSDLGKSKAEAREHIQNIIDTLDHEIEERTKLQVSQRYQAPIRFMERNRKRDDVHFKNFIKTQQKVNDILSKILASNSNKRSSVVTI